jgi:hypothetical protein
MTGESSPPGQARPLEGVMTPATGVLPGKDPCLFLIRYILRKLWIAGEENRKSHETGAEFPAIVRIARVVVPDLLHHVVQRARAGWWMFSSPLFSVTDNYK